MKMFSNGEKERLQREPRVNNEDRHKVGEEVGGAMMMLTH